MKRWIIIGIVVAVLLLASFSLLGTPLAVDDISDKLPKAGEYGSRSLDQIRYIVIHHSASENQLPLDYANFHISKGWPGIGYHFVIHPTGKIWQTNDLGTVSYHVQGNNTPSIGICLSGNLNTHPMARAQERSLKALIGRLKRDLPGPLEIKAHRDFSGTDCPGSFTNISKL